ncbi:MAG: NAD(P)H-hydrate dehydratase [Candidatus Omnitrophica bacterium]|nr:NAD(P)H-hydrate dehydratase [Candidatus Omnitrophota bacterium]
MPTLLSRKNKKAHKNNFGHILIIAGSGRMLGAGALSCISAMRSGAGLVTFAIPKSLNLTAQKKISNCIMTLPLSETKNQTLSLAAFKELKNSLQKYSCIAIGPGLGADKSTQKLILKIIEFSQVPLVIDADALNAIAQDPKILLRSKTKKILTPHTGEMARLTKLKKADIEKARGNAARTFASQYNCVLLLKGNNTVVADHDGSIYINKNGNPGMATAGSGDVLTGIISAFVGQGLECFEAANFGAYIHGKAGDLAAKIKTKISLTASDISDSIPNAIKSSV